MIKEMIKQAMKKAEEKKFSSYKVVDCFENEFGWQIKLLRADSNDYYWMDFWVTADGTLEYDWHQFEFDASSEDDMIRKSVQENPDETDCAYVESVCYLETNGYIVRTEDDQFKSAHEFINEFTEEHEFSETFELWANGYTADGFSTESNDLIKEFSNQDEAISYAEAIKDAFGVFGKLTPNTKIIRLEVEQVIQIDNDTFENLGTIYSQEVWRKE